MVRWRLAFPAAMNFTVSVGLSGLVRGVFSGVVMVAPASWMMRVAAAMSVVRSLPRRSMNASVVPSAT